MSIKAERLAKAINALFFSNKNGQSIIMAEPRTGNHQDVYEIRTLFEQIPYERGGVSCWKKQVYP